jgi:3-oxoadipate CoA-transferase alpha subunit
MLNKVVASLDQAVTDIHDGASVMIGGFGNAGYADGLIAALARQGAKHLTVISNHAGRGESGIAALVKQDRVAKVVCSFPEARDAQIFREKYLAGKIELELVPQGTLAERMRAGGSGIEGFYTPAGVGTEIAEGKETREINGVACVLEHALRADFALIRAKTADRWGNLMYNQSARNFNPVMAMAAKVTIAEVDDIVELGALDPEQVVTPMIFVQRVVKTGRAARA